MIVAALPLFVGGNLMKECIPCDECFAGSKDGVKCSLCYGSGLLKKMKIKTSPTTDWEVYVPSNLSQEEAQAEYEESMKNLCRNFHIDN